MTIKKILIIRFSSIGDIVLTTPVIRCVKNQLEDVELHFCTKEEYAPILEDNPYIDKIHCLSGNLDKLVKSLKKEKFDFIIDLHNNLRTKIIKLRMGVKAASVNKQNVQKWLMVNFKIDKMPNRHIVNRYMDVVEQLGVRNDNLGLEYFIPDKYEVENDWLPETHQREYVAVMIGAKYKTKRLPLNRLIELCDRINKPIVILGGQEDVEVAKELESFFKLNDGSQPYEEGLKELGKKTRIFNACGKFNLHQSASVIKNAKVVFTHDTGLMHIAAAFKKSIFSIWGNTVPKFGMYPYGTKFTILENNKVKCRPCSKIGFDKCPKGHFKCMNDIVFDFYVP